MVWAPSELHSPPIGTKISRWSCLTSRWHRGRESYRPLVGLRAKFDVERLTHWLAAPQPPMPRYPFAAEQRRLLAIWLLGRF